jgi:hypothetical protein
VALVPQRHGGYRMLAAYPDENTVVEWPVDAQVAARLAPFAFTFQPRFAPRALGAADILRFAFTNGAGDLALLLMTGFVAMLMGLLTPVATGWLIDHAIPSGSGRTVGGLITRAGPGRHRARRARPGAQLRGTALRDAHRRGDAVGAGRSRDQRAGTVLPPVLERRPGAAHGERQHRAADDHGARPSARS